MSQPHDELQPLSLDEQQELLEWLRKGASPAAACQQVGVSGERFWLTLARQPAFDDAFQEVFDTLSHNVLAALYQAAMKGNVTAQQFWLRHRLPTAWAAADDDDAHKDPYRRLPDEKLFDLCRAEKIDIPPEIAERAAPADGGP